MPLFRKHGPNVESILEQVRGYWISSIIITAVELDIFSIIEEKELTVNELANQLHLNIDGLERLLDTLTALDILQKHNKLYANTFTAFNHLNRSSDQYIGHIILYHRSRYDIWGRLSESMKTGQPLVSASFLTPNQDLINNYARAMHARAKIDAPNVLLRINLENAKHILDLGGAPGTFAVAFAKEYPNLQITVFDLPDMIPIAIDLIKEYGFNNQIRCIPGNFEEDDFGSEYDVVFMSQILSSIGKEEVQELFNKIYSALKSGGRIINRDLILRNENTEPAVGVFRSLNALLTTENGRTYSVSQLREMLIKSGFEEPHFHQLMGSADLVIAKKK